MNIWSTEDVSPRDGFSFWSEAVCARFMQVSVDRTADAPFHGTLQTASVGDILVNTIDAGAYKVRASHRASSANSEWLFVNVHHKGLCRMRQADRVHEAAGFDTISLNAGIMPFALDFPEPFQLTCFRLPYDGIAARVSDLRSKLARPLPATNATALFTGFAGLLATNANGLPNRAGDIASATFSDLLTLCLSAGDPDDGSHDGAKRAMFF